jgi:hypothetical protein
MAKHALVRSRRSGLSLSFTSFVFLTMGAIIFYFIGQAISPEYAHFTHWGLGALGGVLGFVAGNVADWLSSRTA